LDEREQAHGVRDEQDQGRVHGLRAERREQKDRRSEPGHGCEGDGPRPGAALEDEAVLLGKQGEDSVSAENLAGKIGTINY
jgi:hypothetical protein